MFSRLLNKQAPDPPTNTSIKSYAEHLSSIPQSPNPIEPTDSLPWLSPIPILAAACQDWARSIPRAKQPPLPLLGEGVSRSVFDLDAHSVLKVAKTYYENQTNRREWGIYHATSRQDLLATPLYHADDWSWIVMEKATLLPAEDTRYPYPDYVRLLMNSQGVNKLRVNARDIHVGNIGWIRRPSAEPNLVLIDYAQ